MYKNIVNVLKITKDLMEAKVGVGHRVVDATLGKGNDTLTLARLVGEEGKVYGFDIQDLALEKTEKKLREANLHPRVKLIKDGHENIDSYVNEEIDFIIYNLGYLPGGDKELITREDTTVISIKKALKLLKPNGLLVIAAYIGHRGGLEENQAVFTLLKNLDQKQYNVLKYEFINQINNPPKVYVVERS